VGLVVVAVVLVPVVWIGPAFLGRPAISVDYVARLNELTRPANYDPNDNAAPLYQKAFVSLTERPMFDLLHALDPNDPYIRRVWSHLYRPVPFAGADAEWPDDIDPNKPAVRRLLRQFGRPYASGWVVWPGDLDPNNLQRLAEWIGANERTFVFLNRAAKKPYCWYERRLPKKLLLREYFPSEIRFFICSARYVAQRASYEAFTGQWDQFVQELSVMVVMADHLAAQPFVVDQASAWGIRDDLTRTLLEAIAESPPDAERLLLLQRQMEGCLPPLGVSYLAERMASHDVIQRMFSDDGHGNGRFLIRHFIRTVFRVWYGNGQHYVVDVLEDPTDLGHVFDRVPAHIHLLGRASVYVMQGHDRKGVSSKVDRLFDSIERTFADKPVYMGTQGLCRMGRLCVWHERTGKDVVLEQLPCCGEVRQRAHRCIAHHRAAITVISLLRYRAAKGAFPDTLATLVREGYLGGLPEDPCGEGPLVYRRMGGDFILYSRGSDRDDDGGVHNKFGEGDGDYVFWPLYKMFLPQGMLPGTSKAPAYRPSVRSARNALE